MKIPKPERNADTAIYICTKGRVDDFVGHYMTLMVGATLIRYTRHTPQALARSLVVPWVFVQITLMAVDGDIYPKPNWWSLGWDLAVTLGLFWYVNHVSYALSSMSSEEPLGICLSYLKSIIFYRKIILICMGIGVCWVPFSHEQAQDLVGLAASMILLVTLYALSMGRPWPPAKKARRPLRERLPRLVPRLAPAPS